MPGGTKDGEQEMIDLSDKQKKVMAKILHWYRKPVNESQIFYLYGYAGTGKSTIVNQTIEELRAHTKCKKVVTATYTGKAASVLQRKGVPDAMTIHSMLYSPVKDPKTGKLSWIKKDASAADLADLIVLDECSMIGREISNDIKELRRKILVIGDPGQLPPINDDPGFHTTEPDAFLEEIHRQAEGNPIIRLATMVRKGEALPLNFAEGDCYIAPLNYETREAVFQPDTQVICGTHASRYNYTRAIRERFNITSKTPIAGEPIICCKTNYKHHFFNGFMGNMGEIEISNEDRTDEKGNKILSVDWYMDVYLEDLGVPRFKVLTDPYLFQNHYDGQGKLKRLPENDRAYGLYSEFDWAYLITVHKSQGSSFPNVTVIDDSAVFRENAAKHLYTAITRAENGLTLLHRRYR